MSTTITLTDEQTQQLIGEGWLAPVAPAPAPATAPTPTSAVASGLSLTLTFADGTQRIFAQSSATDLGDFVGEFVHQRCLMAVDGAWRVFFRPDADGSRQEVVVEYGASFSGTPAHLLTPYTASVAQDGTEIYRVTVPKHWWGARWRWQSAPRPVVRDPDVLRSRHWIPNFGPVGLYGKPPVTATPQWAGPMTALAGVDPSMATAGDHDQIGYLTESAADYMIRPADITLAGLRAEGEWIGNACIHLRNNDGSMFDVVAQQLRYTAAGGTLLAPPSAPSSPDPTFIIQEYAHFYPCANAGWMLTDDPYLLEELQFASTWLMLQNAWTKRYGSISGGQTRAFAWGMRDLFACAVTTPATVPAWLRPASYFASCAEINLTWAQKFVAASARIHALFRAWTRTDYLDAWMNSWLTTVIGLAVEAGLSDWRPVFDWAVDQHIQMTSGASGWNRQVCAPYEWFARQNFVEWTQLCDVSADADTCVDWAAAWAYLCAGAVPQNQPTLPSGAANYLNRNADGSNLIDTSAWDGHTLMSGIAGMGTSYIGHLRSALAQAVRLGTPGAQACYDYINAEFPLLLAKHRVYGQARFSIDPGSAT